MIQIGKKYNNWTVINEAAKKNRKKIFFCQCNCGRTKNVREDTLLNNKSKYCIHCRHDSVSISIGQKFGDWTILELIEAEEKRKHYKVQCKCGFIRILKGIRLRFGDSIRCRTCGSNKHGMVHSRTYSTWESMIQRCTNPDNRNYKRYGGRGIKVCEKWKIFENFFKDMGKRPNNLELDRTNNEGNYEPANCKWVTRKENVNNRSISKKNKIK